MNNKKRKLTPHERVILDVMKNSRRPLSTREIAEYGNMSWLTAKKNIERLYRNRKSMHTKKKGNARLWYLK